MSAVNISQRVRRSRAPPVLPSLAGTVTKIGTQTLYDYLQAYRATLPEGLTAANARMRDPSTMLAYCGASTVWRNKLAFVLSGGHGDSYDDGGYAQDLSTGAWETMIPPTTVGASSTVVDSATGEWVGGTAGRPASAHTDQYMVTVGDDIIQAIGTFMGTLAVGCRQAHRWNFAAGTWERYGGGNSEGAVSPAGGAFAHYDSTRNRVVRIELTQVNGNIDTIAANNSAAAWTTLSVSAPGRIGTSVGASIGYHEALDCYVLIDQGAFTPRNTLHVMDAANLTAGWVSVSVSGVVPPAVGESGLAYCPPMQAMATVDPTVGNKLLYIKPTGGRTDPWVWSQETFTGAVATWSGYPTGDYYGVDRRIVWSSLLGGFVVLKKPTDLTELFVPTL